ncbi:MAG: ACP S-malonyltransferase, partial [Silicimonas sp.]|nr:ACP S-malonyltransferase [Silicimonas sp.]
DTLTLTENAQPALMATSMAAMRALEAEGVDVMRAAYVAGHSLGEYSALCAAGSISVADAARLLRVRGRAMQNAVPVGEGAMAAILGLTFDQVAKVAQMATKGEVCQVANENDPLQNVVSGNKAAVERAVELAKEAGAKRAVMLPVSAPFHCALMTPAAGEMARALNDVDITEPKVPLVANVLAAGVHNASLIRSLLVDQVPGRVRWRTSVEWMVEHGVDTFWEVGAGKALSGMIRRISKDAETRTVGTAAEVAEAAASLG